MSNVFTLDDLNNELERRYQPFVFRVSENEEYTLLSLLRVSKDTRKKVQVKLESINEDTTEEDEVVKAVEYVLSAVTENRRGPALVKVLGGDIAKLMIVLQQWRETTQAGEASSSQN